MSTQVAQWMTTNLATISPNSTLSQGLELITRYKTDVLYVIQEDHQFLGIVPDFSLLKACLNGSRFDSTLESLLNRQVPTISHHADILEIAHRFRDGQHCRMAVLNDGKLVGQIQRLQILDSLDSSNQKNPSEQANSDTHTRLDTPHAPMLKQSTENQVAKAPIPLDR